MPAEDYNKKTTGSYLEMIGLVVPKMKYTGSQESFFEENVQMRAL